MRRLTALSLLVLTSLGCVHSLNTSQTHYAAPEPASPSDPVASLAREVAARFADPDFAHAHWGVLIQSLDTGRVWYEQNANRLFMPASNEKIPTTAAALLSLGPDFRFDTYVCRDGEIRGETLQGNLVVFGNGDPTLYTRFLEDPRDVFRRWAGELKEMGITRIAGDVIGDDNTFDDEHLGYGWAHDGLSSWYSAEVGPLQFNENYVDFTITPPASMGGEAVIEGNVPSAFYQIVNDLEVVPAGVNSASFRRPQGSNTITVTGTAVAGSRPFVRTASITNPTLFYVTVLAEVLREEGIAIDGEARDCDAIAGWEHSARDLPVLCHHESPPLAEIIAVLMKRSQNMYAETMVRTMGWLATGLGSFEAGRTEVERVLADLGVGPGTYAFMDGSGLSRYNYLSPRQIVDILRGMRRTPVWEPWINSFPIAGVDGTIARRMTGTPAQGNCRAKTGTISNVRALSGYVSTADGEQLVFSFIVNGYILPTRSAESIQDDVVVMLASFDRGGPNVSGAAVSVEAE